MRGQDLAAKTAKLTVEIAKGSLAMMTFIGMFFQDGLTAFALRDWALYSAVRQYGRAARRRRRQGKKATWTTSAAAVLLCGRAAHRRRRRRARGATRATSTTAAATCWTAGPTPKGRPKGSSRARGCAAGSEQA